ncbi:MAG: 4Fe-4S binding protein [Chloroflexi bacterium]|nr:4Fe-4S binding protein [Chloroflexota bacterium]
MGKLIVRQAKCTGCRLCESICAVSHENKVAVALARLQVVKKHVEGSPAVVICRQCKKCAPFEKCPTGAIKRDADGVLAFDMAACNLCGECIPLCPFDAIRQVGDQMLTCDLCNGDPQCVRFCATRALSLVAQPALA